MIKTENITINGVQFQKTWSAWMDRTEHYKIIK